MSGLSSAPRPVSYRFFSRRMFRRPIRTGSATRSGSLSQPKRRSIAWAASLYSENGQRDTRAPLERSRRLARRRRTPQDADLTTRLQRSQLLRRTSRDAVAVDHSGGDRAPARDRDGCAAQGWRRLFRAALPARDRGGGRGGGGQALRRRPVPRAARRVFRKLVL